MLAVDCHINAQPSRRMEIVTGADVLGIGRGDAPTEPIRAKARPEPRPPDLNIPYEIVFLEVGNHLKIPSDHKAEIIFGFDLTCHMGNR